MFEGIDEKRQYFTGIHPAQRLVSAAGNLSVTIGIKYSTKAPLIYYYFNTILSL